MDEQFKPLTATPIVDPTKHVNYTYGMVLGVDDFTQEFAYHSERDQWMTRDIDGYGTVSGLAVTVAENANGEQEVIVSAGTAVNPRGQLICVPAAQCAVIDKWLAVEANRKAAEAVAAELPPGAPLGLYVVLCYRDCPTDKVPVPGEPCRSEDESVANSRLKDDFRLELRLAPPAQTEELAVREFVRWLRAHVEFTDEAGEFTHEDSFADVVRELAGAAGPSSPPDYAEDSPPNVIRVLPELRCDFLRVAFRVWVTELRPRVRPDLPGSHCSCANESHEHEAQGGDEDCVLLAELQVYLTPDTLVDETREVRVVEAQRPLLVHQRMLQEWLLCGSCCAGEVESLPPAPPAELALDDLSDVSAPAPQESEVLTFSGGQWIAAPPAAGGGGGGATGPAGGDLEGAYPDPTVAGLRGRVVSAAGPSTNQVLTWDGSQWGPADVPAVDAIRPGDAAGGDLTATYPNPTVAGLQTRPVSDAAPNAGDVLTWDELVSQWRPVALPAPPPPPAPPPAVRMLLPFVTVMEEFSDGNAAFFLWFNLDAQRNRAEIVELTRGSLRAFGENPDPGVDFLERVSVLSVDPVAGQRNLFRCEIEKRPPLLRFTFDLRRIQVRVGGSDVPISDYMKDSELNFVGFDGGNTVTTFVGMSRSRQFG